MAIKSVAIIGAGAAGAITAAALRSEDYFERIKVFERRESPGGTWIYDPDPGTGQNVPPGKLPLDIDQPLKVPSNLPTTATPSRANRWTITPIYESLTTNVPDIAMSFSDSPFPYGPFVPHRVARQYIESYFSLHGLDSLLSLNTTVEDLSAVPDRSDSEASGSGRWKLTLRKYDPSRHLDIWWEEFFDAVVIANGHYSVPYIPDVPGLGDDDRSQTPKVMHSKYYRSPSSLKDKRVVVVGNSASGHDVSAECIGVAKHPVYVSRRSRSRWDGDQPPPGIEWKPIIKEFLPSGRIVFVDGTTLDDVDTVIYCTGYKASFPFWNEKTNKGPIWDYEVNKLRDCYWHTFLRNHPTIAVVGIPRTLTFRGFEYQAVAIARFWAKRNKFPLPPLAEQEAWELSRIERCQREHKKFHDIPWDDGETQRYLNYFFEFAGLGTLHGNGRLPPPLGPDLIWAIEHIKKYPEPPKHSDEVNSDEVNSESSDTWTFIDSDCLDTILY